MQNDTHWSPGALCFTAVIIVANLKVLYHYLLHFSIIIVAFAQMFFLQTQWMAVHFIVLFVSVLLWFLVAFTVTSFTRLDFEFFNVI
jgi:hypothetical protein